MPLHVLDQSEAVLRMRFVMAKRTGREIGGAGDDEPMVLFCDTKILVCLPSTCVFREKHPVGGVDGATSPDYQPT